MHQIKCNGYKITSTEDLDEDQVKDLLSLIESKPTTTESLLGGRGSIRFGKLNSTKVVIKEYIRGGVLGLFNKRYYLSKKVSRPQIEFDILNLVREKGVSAPKPIAYVTKGSLFYRGWLILEEVEEAQNLATLSMKEGEGVRQYLNDLLLQIEKLIDLSILHIDLHPGNVLIDKDKQVFLIDFDKAIQSKDEKNKLRDYYLFRWRRAVIKYSLPDFLAEFVCAGLRKKFHHD